MEHFELEGNINHLLAKNESSLSFCSKQLEANYIISNFVTLSDQKPREAKRAPFTHPGYITVLATKDNYVNKSNLGVTYSYYLQFSFTKRENPPYI